MRRRNVYLDHAATTHVCGEALQAMMPHFTSTFGNSSSIHSFGRDAEKALATAREHVAATIGARPDEIYFTSGATEANNWILTALANAHPSKRIIISQIEHPSVVETCEALAKQGFKIDRVRVDENGIISVSDLVSKLSKPAAVVSIMAANNEVGTIQYLNTISNLCRERGVLFHTDATQAISSIFIDVNDMHIHALSLSSHKIYGPKGIGALYIKNGLNVAKYMHGGHQERGMRAGTVNVAGAVGFGEAARVAMRDSNVNNARIRSLRDYMIMQIEQRIQGAKLNGHRSQRLPGNINFSFSCVEGEAILMQLDFAGIAVSTGSACTSKTLQRSHVLSAMGVPYDLINGSIRFSLGRGTTKSDIDYTIFHLEAAIKKVRSISAVR